jgi:hypothetical protein
MELLLILKASNMTLLLCTSSVFIGKLEKNIENSSLYLPIFAKKHLNGILPVRCFLIDERNDEIGWINE